MNAALSQPRIAKTAATSADRQRPADRRDARLVWILTLVAGAARLGTAGVPALWNDEAQTFRRVCGTFPELRDMLRDAPFPPLHYLLTWGLGRALGGAQHLTPFWMRMIPAVCGTLMVPAMWRLAGQLCGTWTALLVAALTACSAYLFAYSHDAKMYMPLWLLVVVNVSLWISWTRGGGGRTWAMWLVTAIAMVSYHASGSVILAVEAAYFVTSRRSSRGSKALAAVGFAVVLLAPACYYAWCNDLMSRSRAMGWHSASGLGWVRAADAGFSPPWRLWSSYLLAWDGPAPAELVHSAGGARGPGGPRFPGTPPLPVPFAATGALLLIAAAWGAASLILGLRNSPRNVSPDGPSGRVFATTFLLAFWLAVPLYAAYCLSASSPGGHGAGPGDGLAGAGVLCFVAAGLLLLTSSWTSIRGRLEAGGTPGPLIDLLAAVLLVAGIAWLVGSACALIAGGRASASSVWVPRYLGFVWPALAIVCCAALSAVRPRAVRWGAVVLLLGLNVAQDAALVFADSEPPVDRIVSDLGEAASSGGKLRTYVTDRPPSTPGAAGGTVDNAVGRYYLSIHTGNRLGPRGFSESELDDFVAVRRWSDPTDIAADLSRGPEPRRLIVWDYAPASGSAGQTPDAPGPQWRVVEDRLIPVRNHWTWQTLYFYRRVQYARQSP